MCKLNILLIDSHEDIINGLRGMLSQSPDFTIVGDAADGIEALEKISSLSPNIVITNIKMPGMDGLELTHVIKTKWPEIKVIILTLYDQYTQRARDIGADAYLLKDIKSTELISTIMNVMKGKKPDNSLI
jgi:DNA-binding NarL/FixJ family response regulator